MNRRIGLERVFNLGPFNSLREIDEFIDIPEQHALNEKLVGRLRYLLLLGAEQTYYLNTVMLDNLEARSGDKNDVEKMIKAILDEKAETLAEIKKLLEA